MTGASEIFSTMSVLFSTSPIGAEPKSTAGLPQKFFTTMAGRRRLTWILSQRQFSVANWDWLQDWSTTDPAAMKQGMLKTSSVGVKERVSLSRACRNSFEFLFT